MFTNAAGRLLPIWSFLLSVALSAAAFLVCGYVAYAVAGEHTLRFELTFRPLLAALLLGIYLWLLTVADQMESRQVVALGLGWLPGSLRQFVSGMLLGLLLTIFAVVPVFIWADAKVRWAGHSLPRILAVVLILLCGALAEELMFRGYPFQRLEEAVGSVAAIAIFSVLFGSVHLMNPGASVWGLLNTVGIGIVLALAYLRTRALWLPWGLHFGWNAALGVVFGLPVSGLRLFNVAVRTTASGPRWLTGGSYGIEAAASGAIAVLSGLLILWKAPLHRLRDVPLPAPPPAEDPDAEHPTGLPPIEN